MKRRIVVALSLLTVAAGLSAAASEEASKRKHRKHRKEAQESVESHKPIGCEMRIASVLVASIYNNAHHRIQYSGPDGKRVLIFKDQSRQVDALFSTMDPKIPGAITVEDMEKNHHLIEKGEHTYILRLTSEGLCVHRVTDSKKVTKGKVLCPLQDLLTLDPSKPVVKDLNLVHLGGGQRSKTSAFKLYAQGELLKEMQRKDPRIRSTSTVIGTKK